MISHVDDDVLPASLNSVDAAGEGVAEQQEVTVAEPDEIPAEVILARYGAVPQVARFACRATGLRRGDTVVIESDRGEELAMVLESLKATSDQTFTGWVLRNAEAFDLERGRDFQREAEAQFGAWLQRAATWKLQLEIIDLEWTLDRKLILYVLNDRGAETTRLALLTAANGLGIVHVQPVSAEGVVVESGGGGCGSGGCGSGGCSTH